MTYSFRLLIRFASTFIYFCFYGINYCQDPQHFVINQKSGLPSNTIYSILNTNDGIMWFGSSLGLANYNGKITKAIHTPELNDIEFLMLAHDKFNRIWFINLSHHVGIYGPDSSISFLPQYYNSSIIFDFFTMGDFLYIKYEKQSVDSSFMHIYDLSTFDINYNPIRTFTWAGKTQLIKNNHKIIIIDSYENITNIFGKEWEYCNENSYKVINPRCSSELFQDSIQINYYNSYIFLQIKDYIDSIKIPSKINGFRLLNELIFIHTINGLFIYNIMSKKLQHYFKNFNISNTNIDEYKSLYVASLYDGVFIVPNLDILFFKIESQNNKKIFSSQKVNNSNGCIAGSNNGIFAKFSSDSTQINALGNCDRVNSIEVIGNNFLLGGDRILAMVDTNLNILKKLDTNISIKHLYKYNDSILFAGSSFSILKITFHHNNTYTINRYKTPFRVYAIWADSLNNFWIGSNLGLVIYNEKMDLTSQLNQYNISCLCFQPPYTMWVGTYGNGIMAYHINTYQKMAPNRPKLNSPFINTIKLDRLNQLWIGTTKGLVISGENLSSPFYIDANTNLPDENIKTITLSDDFAWIGSNVGVTKYPYKYILTDSSFYIPTVKKIYTNFGIKKVSEPITFTFDEREIKFIISYPTLKYKGFEKFEYKLYPLSKNWLTVNQSELKFNDLPPGNYRLFFKAIHPQNISLSPPQFIDFKRLNPWYRSWAFYLTILLLLGVALYLFFQFRIDQIKNKEKLKAEFQGKIDKLSLDALRSQMNPHFVYNTLNAIQDFIVTNDQKSALSYLNKFAKITRTVFNQSAASEISLKDELSFIELYLELEKLRFGDNIFVELVIDNELHAIMDNIFIPPLILQPIIENAFKHGQLHKFGNGKLKIHFYKENNYLLKCKIEDNGTGIDNTLTGQSKTFKRRSSLRVVEQRLGMHYKEFIQDDYIPIETYSNHEMTMKPGTVMIVNFILYAKT